MTTNPIQETLLRDTWSREKKRLKMPGVYKITNKLTSEFYIGASTNIFTRWHAHLSLIRSGKHHVKRVNEAFQSSGLQHPLDLFEIEVLERTTDLAQKESEYIETLQPSLNQSAAPKRRWSEPCTESMTFQVTPTMKRQLESRLLDNWQDVVRAALEKAIRDKLADQP
jgi:group I intron endonuclease